MWLYYMLHAACTDCTAWKAMPTFAPLYLCTFAPLCFWTFVPLCLCTFAPLYLCTFVPLHLCTSGPLWLCAFAPLHHSSLCFPKLQPRTYMVMYHIAAHLLDTYMLIYTILFLSFKPTCTELVSLLLLELAQVSHSVGSHLCWVLYCPLIHCSTILFLVFCCS